MGVTFGVTGWMSRQAWSLTRGIGEQRSTARSRVSAVIVFWNGALVVLDEKEFHHEGTKARRHEGTKFSVKSPGLAQVVRILRGFVVKQALARTPMPSRPR